MCHCGQEGSWVAPVFGNFFRFWKSYVIPYAFHRLPKVGGAQLTQRLLQEVEHAGKKEQYLLDNEQGMSAINDIKERYCICSATVEDLEANCFLSDRYQPLDSYPGWTRLVNMA